MPKTTQQMGLIRIPMICSSEKRAPFAYRPLEITGYQLANVSEGGIATLFQNNGQTFGAVGDGRFAAGVESFQSDAMSQAVLNNLAGVPAVSANDLAPTEETVEKGWEHIQLVEDAPGLAQGVEAADVMRDNLDNHYSPPWDTGNGKSQHDAAYIAQAFKSEPAIARNVSTQNALRRAIGLNGIDRGGLLTLGGYDTGSGAARNLAPLRTEIGRIREVSGIVQ